MNAPGAWRRCRDVWGPFEDQARSIDAQALVLADERVLRLHPHVAHALRGRNVIALKAGERAKSMHQLTRLSRASPDRCSGVVVIGGGTLGDLGTVLAHLIRRGVPLTHVPTTLLAAVDSSVGGKGAVHACANGRWIKNAWGVFHYPEAAWLCPELWTTLTPRQRRQGEIEALKMEVCLERRWKQNDGEALVRRARALKERVCAEDPYDTEGARRVLNFGHTFGHAFETLSNFRLAHGDAVALGMLQALDLGLSLGVTPHALAREVEAALQRIGAPGRDRLERELRNERALLEVIAADKKGASRTGANMVLLEAPGRARVHWVELRPGRSMHRSRGGVRSSGARARGEERAA